MPFSWKVPAVKQSVRKVVITKASRSTKASGTTKTPSSAVVGKAPASTKAPSSTTTAKAPASTKAQTFAELLTAAKAPASCPVFRQKRSLTKLELGSEASASVVAKELPSALRGKLAETIVSFDDDLTSSFGGSKSKVQDQANLSTRNIDAQAPDRPASLPEPAGQREDWKNWGPTDTVSAGIVHSRIPSVSSRQLRRSPVFLPPPFDQAPPRRPAVNTTEMQARAKMEKAIIISDSPVKAGSASGHAEKPAPPDRFDSEEKRKAWTETESSPSRSAMKKVSLHDQMASQD
ncbi:1,4-alpha-glucan-branching enzyme [Venturia inaequalis]|nr:1,4-alpha-glucan-branching enzyme [Venturia inaequalis]